MKKIIWFLILMWFLFLWNTFATVCNDFDAGKLCIGLQSAWGSQYSVKVKFFPNEKKYSYKLDCQVWTPDGYIKDVGTCSKTFDYAGSGIWQIEYYISLEWQNKVIKDSYDFTNKPDPVFPQEEKESDDDSNSSNQSNDDQYSFTQRQLKDIKSVYNMWPSLITKLEKKYSKLKKNQDWQDFQEYIYQQLDSFVNDEDSDIQSYSQFKEMIIDFIKLTKKER